MKDGPRSRPTPVVFGPPGSQLFGLHHAPASHVARGVGVVLCAPLGYEAMCVHRTYRHWAERLAVAGFHALRFDYRGTGDSSGDADGRGRLESWLADIDAAIDELQAITGVRSVHLVGVRLGATLATLAAARRRDVKSLVLWAPCVSGRRYVRELRAFRTLRKDIEEPDAAVAAAGEEIAGYWFDQAALDDLAAIDLLASSARVAGRALIVPRDDMPAGEERLAAHLAGLGVDATARAEPGYAEMMRDPQETTVPAAALDAIATWLRDEPDAAEPADRPAARAPARILVASSRAADHPVREEPLWFGEQRGLFGVLTEPDTGTARPARPAVVFLNVGANHRVGPNRMYVSLARELASRGYTCLRFDRAGLGDSPPADGEPEGRVYSKDAVGDVAEAISFLEQARAIEQVILVGICSGAHLAFHAGRSDPRVIGQILINPPTFEWGESDSPGTPMRQAYKSTRYYLSAALRRRIWSRAVRGELDVRGVTGVLRERLGRRIELALGELMARWQGRPVPRTHVEAAFCEMSDRGVESLLVFSASDGGLDMIEEHLGRDARRMRGRKNVRFAIVAGADHTFTPIGSQREIGALVTSFVEGRFP